MLLLRAERAAFAAGAAAVWLQAWSGNRRALDFYARRGYADLGPTPFTIEDERFENRLFARGR